METTPTHSTENSSEIDPVIRIVSSDPRDMAFQKPYIFFTLKVAAIALIPSTIAFAMIDNIVIGGSIAGAWSIACIHLLIGGTARMAGIDLDQNTSPSSRDGINLIKERFISLTAGFVVFAIALILAIGLVSGIVAGLSRLSVALSALLTIPAIILVLIAASILFNANFYGAVVGYENKGFIESAKILIDMSLKKPFLLLSNSFNIFESTILAMWSSGIALLLGLSGAFALTILPQFNQDLSIETFLLGTAGVIRFGSIGLVLFLWVTYLVNVITISFTINYRDSST